MFPKRICFCRLFGYRPTHRLRELKKKIVIEDETNAPKQVRVDAFLCEYLIDVRAGAAQLDGEPSY